MPWLGRGWAPVVVGRVGTPGQGPKALWASVLPRRRVGREVASRPQSRRRTLAGSLNAARTAGPVADRTDIPSSVKPAKARVLRSPVFTPKITDLSNRVSQTAAPAPIVSPIADGNR